MLLRICAVVCLVAMAAAQDTTIAPTTTMEATPTPEATPTMEATTMEATTMEATTMEATTTEATTPGVTTDAGPTTSGPTANDTLATRFAGQSAYDFRRRHFYCVELGESFPPKYDNNADLDARRPYYWAIFLQYPVLSYLDSYRKERLFYVIARLVQDGSDINTPLASFNETDFCIGDVTHYKVSEYEESILVNMYFRGNTVYNPTSPSAITNISNFTDAFTRGFERARSANTGQLVAVFEERDALVIDVELPGGSSTTQTELNKHPGVVALAEDRSRDPTFRAIVIGTFSKATTIDEAFESNNLRARFANNPDPTNFGLEAGDIVFAVFGGIFLTVLMGLCLLGFCIHPFFLA